MYEDKKNWSEEELAEWEAASEEEKEAWKAEGKTFGSEEKEALDGAKSFMQRHARKFGEFLINW